jgi:hypothetical protein
MCAQPPMWDCPTGSRPTASVSGARTIPTAAGVPGWAAGDPDTSSGGAGATHVVFGITNPFTQDGASLDLVLRLVDALPPAVPTIDLRTACFTLEIK